MEEQHDNTSLLLISNILNMIGIIANLDGYRYLRETIYQKLTNPSYNNTKLLEITAEKYKNKANNVNSSIHHALFNAWKSKKILKLNEFFGVENFNPDVQMSNYRFISSIADLIKIKKIEV